LKIDDVKNGITRQALGLAPACSVSATFGDLEGLSASYLRALCTILKRFPKHFHLFAGSGDVKTARTHLHAEGVLPQVRFVGTVALAESLIEVVDLYLTPFPSSQSDFTLKAIAAGKPVVAMRTGGSESAAGTLAASTEGGYVDAAGGVIRKLPVRS